jgi:hypothetical protein
MALDMLSIRAFFRSEKKISDLGTRVLFAVGGIVLYNIFSNTFLYTTNSSYSNMK